MFSNETLIAAGWALYILLAVAAIITFAVWTHTQWEKIANYRRSTYLEKVVEALEKELKELKAENEMLKQRTGYR